MSKGSRGIQRSKGTASERCSTAAAANGGPMVSRRWQEGLAMPPLHEPPSPLRAHLLLCIHFYSPRTYPLLLLLLLLPLSPQSSSRGQSPKLGSASRPEVRVSE
eukprot:GHVU01106807.1.p1 GENE.GHVU01106807.1~~GHVU01106807.1.p1  ORF type:complete len:104 (+),score=10.96 GHVU01106807.1:566-877(+)